MLANYFPNYWGVIHALYIFMHKGIIFVHIIHIPSMWVYTDLHVYYLCSQKAQSQIYYPNMIPWSVCPYIITFVYKPNPWLNPQLFPSPSYRVPLKVEASINSTPAMRFEFHRAVSGPLKLTMLSPAIGKQLPHKHSMYSNQVCIVTSTLAVPNFVLI